MTAYTVEISFTVEAECEADALQDVLEKIKNDEAHPDDNVNIVEWPDGEGIVC